MLVILSVVLLLLAYIDENYSVNSTANCGKLTSWLLEALIWMCLDKNHPIPVNDFHFVKLQ